MEMSTKLPGLQFSMVGKPLPTSFHAGIDPTVIALWMGHASVASTKPYIHADMTLKQQAADRLTPPGVKPGRYQAPDELLAFLADL